MSCKDAAVVCVEATAHWIVGSSLVTLEGAIRLLAQAKPVQGLETIWDGSTEIVKSSVE